MIRYDRQSIGLAIALSALAGYVDASGFLATGGFFVSFMSGNSTRLGIALSSHRYVYAGVFLLVVTLFVFGVMAGYLVSKRAGRRRKTAVLGLVSVLLLAAAVVKSFSQENGFAAGLLVLAMGAENAVFQRDGETSIGLTYMTGTLVKLGRQLAEAVAGGERWNWVPYASLWAGLVGGAVTGAAAHSMWGSFALWPAAGSAIVMTTYSRRIEPTGFSE